jgi:hypothetical protein
MPEMPAGNSKPITASTFLVLEKLDKILSVTVLKSSPSFQFCETTGETGCGVVKSALGRLDKFCPRQFTSFFLLSGNNWRNREQGYKTKPWGAGKNSVRDNSLVFFLPYGF